MYALIFVPIILSGVLGFYLDTKQHIDFPALYWLIGAFGSFLSMFIIIMMILLKLT